MDKLASVVKDLEVFKKYYDEARIVDPLRKEVVFSHSTNGRDTHKLTECFTFWQTKQMCANCVGFRAANSDEATVKYQIKDQATYLITAIPVKLSTGNVVIELMKKMSDGQMLLNMGKKDEENSQPEIEAVVNSLNNAVVRDPLTALYNQNFINERLVVDVVRANMENTPLTLVLADIDHLGQLNRKIGRQAGDEVIKAVGTLLAARVRSCGDWIARCDGGEFLICLPGAEIDQAYEVAEFMRKVIEVTGIETTAGAVKATVSFGISSLTREEAEDGVTALLSRATMQLQLAKASGRNHTYSD
jgi:diguanylate cyclase (GGDEF)-like protein